MDMNLRWRFSESALIDLRAGVGTRACWLDTQTFKDTSFSAKFTFLLLLRVRLFQFCLEVFHLRQEDGVSSARTDPKTKGHPPTHEPTASSLADTSFCLDPSSYIFYRIFYHLLFLRRFHLKTTVTQHQGISYLYAHANTNMPVPSLILTTAKTSIFIWGAGWFVQLYRQRIQRIQDQERYDLETKKCPTWEELMAMRAKKGMFEPET